MLDINFESINIMGANIIDINDKSRVIFIFDSQREYLGLVDQLKAMIGILLKY